MKLMVISLILIWQLSSVLAACDVNAPSETVLQENFTVAISADISDISDVKIYIQNAEGKISSEIYNQAWKNSFYYVASIFPEKKEYLLRATKTTGNLEICAKLRKTGSKTIVSCTCRPIKVKELSATANEPSSKSSTINQETTPKKQKQNEDSQKQAVPQNNNLAPVSENRTITAKATSSHLTESNEEKIVLTSPKKFEQYISPTERLRLGISYGFSVVTLIIILLLLLRKI